MVLGVVICDVVVGVADEGGAVGATSPDLGAGAVVGGAVGGAVGAGAASLPPSGTATALAGGAGAVGRAELGGAGAVTAAVVVGVLVSDFAGWSPMRRTAVTVPKPTSRAATQASGSTTVRLLNLRGMERLTWSSPVGSLGRS